MVVNHKEIAFEDAIEQCLLSTGYSKGDPEHFDRAQTIHTGVFLNSSRTHSRPSGQHWRSSRANTAHTLVDDLCKALDSQGSLSVLRHGFKCFGKLFRLSYFRPSHSLNPETERLYKANRLTITRQLCYSTKNENCLDIVLSLNGIPVATAELKNPMSGQNVEHAKRQYRNDRDPARRYSN